MTEEATRDEVQIVREVAATLLQRGVASNRIRFNAEFVDALHERGWSLTRD